MLAFLPGLELAGLFWSDRLFQKLDDDGPGYKIIGHILGIRMRKMVGFQEIWALLLIIHSSRQSSSANHSAESKISVETTTPPVSASNLSTVTEKNNFVLQRTNFTSDPSIFPICIPACINGGICRRIDNDVSTRCLCPLDYEGQTCEQSVITPLTTCTESTCHNGGFCAKTTENLTCSCPAGVSGSTCERRSRAYKVSMRLVQFGQPMEWDTAFDDSSSAVYQQTVPQILRLLHLATLLGNDLMLVRAYQGISFDRFISGSVIASVFLKFDFNDSMAKTYDNKLVLEHLISGGKRLSESNLPASIPSLIIFEPQDAAVFSVQATDPCSSGNNDCSVNGICVPLSGTVYTCECKTFTIDVSPSGFYPGRRCIYDGLIILTFVVVGLLLSMLIFVLCGCRRTIWYRYRNRREAEHVTLVKMAANYDI
ncbi:hypothetical protein CRM22_000669 [Opisthorchis felineus]|uniref:EGF-like domain-containing protein n=1 Tax=Opisthorchis felineus TaxID=147828 RepID=A0A4S2MDZ8_OPIFE|nr:hypothetical protein CRM22_000669 [Opisthorchis felineus]